MNDLHSFLAELAQRYEHLAAGRKVDGSEPPNGPTLSSTERALCGSFAHDLRYALREFQGAKAA